MLGLFGSGAILTVALLLLLALAAGYFLGGPDRANRRVPALCTAQRNLAAAFVLGAGNSADRPDVLVLLAAAGLVGMVVVLPVTGEFGKRAKAAAAANAAPAPGVGTVAAGDPPGRS